jgi:hypothetical protein
MSMIVKLLLSFLVRCSSYCLKPGPIGDVSWIDCILTGQNSGKKGYFFLPAGTYYLDRQLQLPDNVYIEGAGTDKTIIQAIRAVTNGCGEKAEQGGDPTTRIGFVLSSNSWIGKFKFVAMDERRWQGYAGAALCGGGVFETPGCSDAYCKSPTMIGDQRYGHGGIHTTNVFDVQIRGFSPTVGPQLAVFITQTKDLTKPSYDINITGVDMDYSWCDGINVHGAAHHVKVENCRLAHQGDDNLAVWSSGDLMHDVTFKNNWVSQLESTNPSKTWGNCVALYGGGSGIKIEGLTCEHTSNGGVKFADGSLNFGGSWSQNTNVLVRNITTFGPHMPDCIGQQFITAGLVNNCPKSDTKGCSDPCWIHNNCKGAPGYSADPTSNMGVGWYCGDGMTVSETTSFDHCCIHPNCGVGPAWSDSKSMWICKDDLPLEDVLALVQTEVMSV